MIKIQDLVNQALAEGKPTSWFESVYEQANYDPQQIPWANLSPQPLLLDWLQTNPLDTVDKKAVVIGCGLGDDCEILSQLGLKVTAFDVSSTAINWCRQRFPDSRVDYQVADLLALPTAWQNHFDLVVEIRTIQSLPVAIREQVSQAIANLVKPGGLLFLVANVRGEAEPLTGPPWAMSESELQGLQRFSLVKLSQVNHSSLVRILYQKLL